MELVQLAVARDQAVEIAEIQKAIDVAKKTQERSAAIAASESVRAKAIQAEEQALITEVRTSNGCQSTTVISTALYQVF